MICNKCDKDVGELITDYGVCEKCWDAMDDQQKREQAFKATVAVKREQNILKDRMDNLKLYWEQEVEGGLGKLVVLEETGNGVRFAMRKGGVSKAKLKELGVSTDILDQATATYKGFEIF